MWEQLAWGGISLVGSLFTGAVQKNASDVPNKLIPLTNPVIWGGTAGGATQQPENVASAIVGSLLAWGVHAVGKRIQRR
jgi:hypothetical protein